MDAEEKRKRERERERERGGGGGKRKKTSGGCIIKSNKREADIESHPWPPKRADCIYCGMHFRR